MDEDELEDLAIADALITDSRHVLENNLEECPETQRARFLQHLRTWLDDQ